MDENFTVVASNDEEGTEGPFIFRANSTEAAAQMYRDWAWSMVSNSTAPAHLQTGGPLPHIEVRSLTSSTEVFDG